MTRRRQEPNLGVAVRDSEKAVKSAEVRRTFTLSTRGYRELRREAAESGRSAQRQLNVILAQRYGLDRLSGGKR